jgi:hypothetical protein
MVRTHFGDINAIVMKSDNTTFRDGQRDVVITPPMDFRFLFVSSFSKSCRLSLHLTQHESSPAFPNRRRLFLGLPLSANRFHSHEHFINLCKVDLGRLRFCIGSPEGNSASAMRILISQIMHSPCYICFWMLRCLNEWSECNVCLLRSVASRT